MQSLSSWHFTLGMRRLSIITLFVISQLATTLSGIPFLGAEDWPQFRGVNRDGKSTSTGLLASWKKTKPPLVRSISGAGTGYASLCVVNGVIYTTGNSQRGQFVSAFKLDSGKKQWSTEIVGVVPNHAFAGSRSTPTVNGKNLFVLASDGKLVCLDLKGKLKWERQLQTDFGGSMMSGWGFAESPLVDDDKVIITPGNGPSLMVALEAQTGKEVWNCSAENWQRGKNSQNQKLPRGAGYSSIAVARIIGEKQYIQFLGNGIIGVRAKDGILRWHDQRAANPVANCCMPIALANNVLYSSTHLGGTARIAIDLQKNKVTTELGYHQPANRLQCHHGGMVLHEGVVYMGHGKNQGYPVCFDFQTGKTNWGGVFRGPGNGSAAVVYCDGNLIFRYQNGVIALIQANPKQYNLLGSFQQEIPSENQSWAHPVVVDGLLLLRENNEIMCYDLNPAE
ncbi:MAG: PQQ-like beta-propeller repeat protein, partial [Pirellulaceae bacterium]|nr:PQQ-like beta-propeller repeat protein [Pirellulaceae bacterium]